MARPRSVLLGMEIRPAGKACKCKHDGSHRIAKGDLRLIVKNPGPASGEAGYCVPCGCAMLEAACDALEVHISSLRRTAS